MKVMLHRHGSSVVLLLRDNLTETMVSGLLYWPPREDIIYFLSNSLEGASPVYDDWRRLGYTYSYMLCSAGAGQESHTFDPMHYLPTNFSFYNYGNTMDTSRIGEAAFKMDLNSLRKGEALQCSIETISDVTVSGRLFRNKFGHLYILHNDSRASGSHPAEEDWRSKTAYGYSWQILEHDLRNDCKPETYKYLGPAIKIYDYDGAKPAETAHDQMIRAKSIVGENVGARVEVITCNGKRINGVLVKQRDQYYILHDNPDAAGDKPRDKMYSLHGEVTTTYSWNLDYDVVGSSQIQQHTFKLLHSIPIKMTTASSIKTPVSPASYDPTTFEKKESKKEELSNLVGGTWAPLSDGTVTDKREEPELILFTKPTAKVTRCDVQPMQSPQIITKNKK